jgi:limonene-1,2-epoxide hydrolase
MEPAEGIDATMAVINMFVDIGEALDFEVHHLASDGSTVLTERTDSFTINGKKSPLPVMGAFHVVDGKITAWRDYFDMAQVTAIFGSG